REQVPFELLEQRDAVASAWRGHYDRLHLHTSKGLSTLPYLGFPRDVPRYPTRAHVVAYLEEYARRFGLAPRFGERVVSVCRDGDGWLTRSEGAAYRSRHVVVATGYTRAPHRPTWPGLDAFAGRVLHSSEYRNGKEWAGRRVLVVGFGNSGGEIAIDLAEHGARPSMSVRSPVNIVPRDFMGLPILAWGIALSLLPVRVADAIAWLVSRLAVGRLERLGLAKLPYGPMTQIRRHRRIPLLDIGTVARIRRREIEVLPGVDAFVAGGARFAGGVERAFDAVVLATGYRPALSAFLDPAAEVVDENGVPRASGAETLPGLYFCGFYVAPTGMLREIARDARRIARAIARPRR
ncbi:MAG TPA: NAD(P)/FAD-dependent oxidoreductase, partial [Haliangiales bacterium]|nr:NAD(P)/FAD-dependent oxidoreductase [Haliangiales bacterium]